MASKPKFSKDAVTRKLGFLDPDVVNERMSKDKYAQTRDIQNYMTKQRAGFINQDRNLAASEADKNRQMRKFNPTRIPGNRKGLN